VKEFGKRLLGLGAWLFWWVLDGFTQIAFAVGVWILSDLPNGIEAWRWEREQRRQRAMKERERRGN
jgi:hypothetical protein